MKCPSCGYVTFDRVETCKRCGGALGSRPSGRAARAAAPDDRGQLDFADLLLAPVTQEKPAAEESVGEAAASGGAFADTAEEAPATAPAEEAATEAEEEAGADFNLDQEIVPSAEAPAPVDPAAKGPAVAAPPLARAPRARAPVPPPPRIPSPPADAGPIIDRDEEVPDRFWALEGAALGRRLAALALDQILLAALLGLFVLGALLALEVTGRGAGLLLAAPGLRAAALPFGLLALLLSLGYYTFFHGRSGRTPGKLAAGIEVRARDGAPLSYARALLRWLAALVAVAAAGAGVGWALFEPRRLGWADLLSGTVLCDARDVD